MLSLWLALISLTGYIRGFVPIEIFISNHACIGACDGSINSTFQSLTQSLDHINLSMDRGVYEKYEIIFLEDEFYLNNIPEGYLGNQGDFFEGNEQNLDFEITSRSSLGFTKLFFSDDDESIQIWIKGGRLKIKNIIFEGKNTDNLEIYYTSEYLNSRPCFSKSPRFQIYKA